MVNWIIAILASTLLPALLLCERSGQAARILWCKTALSTLFVVAAAVQPKPIPAYFILIFGGLCFSLGGDVFLALKEERMFLRGTISFLVGHLFYCLAFFGLAVPGVWTAVGTAVTVVVSGAVYLRLRSLLGPMKGPGTAYIFVISLMMVGAWSLAGTADLNQWGRAAVFGGASFFYLSDIFVARDRFCRRSFVNRLIGLPMYYLGQFLLAFSVGMMGRGGLSP